MLLRLSACLGCLLLLGSLQAQQALVIQDIRLEGHQRNQADYLFRFLESEAGQIFNASRAEQDAQQLQNLYSIAKADFRVDTLPENAIMLTFSIEEAWTFFPLFSINAVRNNLWLEIGANEINFLGRGMQLTGAYRNIDGRHNYQVFFRQPYIGGSQWGVFAGVHRYASTEPLYFSQGAVFYDYTNQSFDLGVSYELKPGHRLEAGAVYFIEDYAKTPDQELANPPGPDGLSIPKWLFKITHRYDRINYDGIYLDGLLNVTLLETVINTDDGSRFDMAINDLHLYRRLGTRGNLAMRLRLGLSTNLNTPFAPFVLDSRVNIRGAGNRIDRGTGTLVLNLEYRYTFWEGNQFAVQGVLFSDAGAWRTAGGNFDDFVNPDYFRHFVGPGFRVMYKRAYNAVFRLDYGVDIYEPGERGVVVGFGQYF